MSIMAGQRIDLEDGKLFDMAYYMMIKVFEQPRGALGTVFLRIKLPIYA